MWSDKACSRMHRRWPLKPIQRPQSWQQTPGLGDNWKWKLKNKNIFNIIAHPYLEEVAVSCWPTWPGWPPGWGYHGASTPPGRPPLLADGSLLALVEADYEPSEEPVIQIHTLYHLLMSCPKNIKLPGLICDVVIFFERDLWLFWRRRVGHLGWKQRSHWQRTTSGNISGLLVAPAHIVGNNLYRNWFSVQRGRRRGASR